MTEETTCHYIEEGEDMSCGELFNCCSCGDSSDGGCGCRYCFTCNACDRCQGGDE